MVACLHLHHATAHAHLHTLGLVRCAHNLSRPRAAERSDKIALADALNWLLGAVCHPNKSADLTTFQTDFRAHPVELGPLILEVAEPDGRARRELGNRRGGGHKVSANAAVHGLRLIPQ